MPNKGDINPITNKPYAVNPNTGVWDDTYWAEVVEPALKQQYGIQDASNNPAMALIQTTIDEYTKKAEAYTAKYNEFEKNNPFVMDKVLGEERAKVAQRLDPYYTQTLGDYLTGVDTQIRRGVEDERTMLTELNQDTTTYEGNAKIQLTDAIEKSREGAADAGLYNSGQALREQGKIERESGQNLSDYLTTAQRKKEDIQKTQERNAQDLTLQKAQKTRDLGQEQYYQTEAQTQTAVGERQKLRSFEQGQYTGAPAGVDPTQFSQKLYNYLGA